VTLGPRILAIVVSLTLATGALTLAACGARTELDVDVPVERAPLPDAGLAGDRSPDASLDAPDAPDAERLDDAHVDDAQVATPDAASPLPDAGLPDVGPPPTDAGATPDAPLSCDGGVVTGNIFGTQLDFAGGQPLPAGHYAVTYVDGCMKYSGDQAWTVQAEPGVYGWSLLDANGNVVATPPGTVGYLVGQGGFSDFDDCVAANIMLPPIDFDFAGGTIGLWLQDDPYDDNVAGTDGRNPTWSLACTTPMP
jgi:hypothetical protein